MGISEITTTPTITQAGLKLAAMRNNQHLSLNITHASFGTAKYNPDGNEKALKREFLRIGVASAVKINDKTIQMRFVLQASPGHGFWVNEIGFWDNETLFAVHSSTAARAGLVYISDLVETTISFSLSLEAMPIDRVDVVISQDVDKVTQLIIQHEGLTNPHPQYATKIELNGKVNKTGDRMTGNLTLPNISIIGDSQKPPKISFGEEENSAELQLKQDKLYSNRPILGQSRVASHLALGHKFIAPFLINVNSISDSISDFISDMTIDEVGNYVGNPNFNMDHLPDGKFPLGYYPFFNGVFNFEKAEEQSHFSMGFVADSQDGEGVITLGRGGNPQHFHTWTFKKNGALSAGDFEAGSKSLSLSVQHNEFAYRKVGNNEAYRFADGTLIQTYELRHNGSFLHKSKNFFKWMESFRGSPKVFVQISGTERYEGGLEFLILKDQKNSETTCHYMTLLNKNIGDSSANVHFFAIGRWK